MINFNKQLEIILLNKKIYIKYIYLRYYYLILYYILLYIV